jgi:phage FluMu protein Com
MNGITLAQFVVSAQYSGVKHIACHRCKYENPALSFEMEGLTDDGRLKLKCPSCNEITYLTVIMAPPSYFAMKRPGELF